MVSLLPMLYLKQQGYNARLQQHKEKFVLPKVKLSQQTWANDGALVIGCGVVDKYVATVIRSFQLEMEKLVDYLIVVHFLLQKQNAATYSCSKDTNQMARALKG